MEKRKNYFTGMNSDTRNKGLLDSPQDSSYGVIPFTLRIPVQTLLMFCVISMSSVAKNLNYRESCHEF